MSWSVEIFDAFIKPEYFDAFIKEIKVKEIFYKYKRI